MKLAPGKKTLAVMFIICADFACSNDKTASALANVLRSEADYEVQTVQSNFGTDAGVQKFAPHDT